MIDEIRVLSKDEQKAMNTALRKSAKIVYKASASDWQPIETAPRGNPVWVKSIINQVKPFQAIYIEDREVTKTNHVIVRDKWQCVDNPSAYVNVSMTNGWSMEPPK